MKYLIVTQYYFPENFNINNIVAELKSRGHQVTVITGLPNYPFGRPFGDYKLLKTEIVNGVNVFRVPMFPRYSGRSTQLIVNYLSFFLSCSIFGFMYLLGKDFDVVISTAYSPPSTGLIGGLFAKFKKAKSLLLVQDLWPFSLQATNHVKNKFILFFVEQIVKVVYNCNHYLLLNSYSFLDIIHSQGINKNKLIYFPDWPDDAYLNIPKIVNYPFPDHYTNFFKIIFCGNIGKAQSIETIINAAILTQSYKILWIIVGDGSMAGHMKNLIKKYSLNNVVMTGFVVVDKTVEYLKACDVGLVTLVNDDLLNSTLPYKVYSYMACSLPILASLNGDGLTVISLAKCGVVVQPDNPEALANAAIDLSQMEKEKLNVLGANGLNYCVDNYDKDMLINRLENLVKLDHPD